MSKKGKVRAQIDLWRPMTVAELIKELRKAGEDQEGHYVLIGPGPL